MNRANERNRTLRGFVRLFFAKNIEKEKDIWYNLLKYKSGEEENEEI
jgi:hypothetical protein